MYVWAAELEVDAEGRCWTGAVRKGEEEGRMEGKKQLLENLRRSGSC
jgi:hypothetical protein